MNQNKGDYGKRITCLLYDEGMIKTWARDKPEGWTLVSGIWSPFYINLRPLASKRNSKEILSEIGSAMGTVVKRDIPYISRLVGLYIAGIPLASAITLMAGIPSCFGRNLPDIKTKQEFYERLPDLRKKLEEHGEHGLVEGDFCDGDQIAIIDDLATKFNTKLVAKAQIQEAAKDKKVSVSCTDVVVLIDREQGAKEIAETNGMKLWSLIPFKTKGVQWLKDRMRPLEYEIITDYLKDEKKYQDQKLQNELRDAASTK